MLHTVSVLSILVLLPQPLPSFPDKNPSGGVPDVVNHGINGLMIDPLSTREISQAILKLFRDKDLRQELGANGRSLAESEWTWSKVAQRLIEATR